MAIKIISFCEICVASCLRAALAILLSHRQCLEFHLELYLFMASGGLRAVRDALVTANAYELIDDDEFVLLYDAYSSKAIFPYWKFPKFDADAWSDVECHTELRFAKRDLDGLLECLGIPETMSSCLC